MIDSNIGPNSALLRYIRVWSPSDLDFDHPRSLKVKGDGVIGLSIYDVLLMVNSNIGPNSTPLRDIEL